MVAMALMSMVDKARRKVGTALAAEQPGTGADILDTLKAEHEEVAQLLERLVSSESAPTRRSLLKQIEVALVPHLRAEEKVVYDAIRSLQGKQEKQDGAEGYLEHRLADKTLATLNKADSPTSPEFSA